MTLRRSSRRHLRIPSANSIMHKRSPTMTSPPGLPCHTNLPLVGIVCDRFFVGEHDQHGVKESYRRALSDVAGVAPVFIPATGAISDVTPYLRIISGLLFPGCASNVAPALYGGKEPAEFPLDPARDHVAVQLIRGAVSQRLPMLAIGRGFQEMNVAFGCTLHPDIYAAGHNERHRENLSEPLDMRYRYKHRISLAPDGLLHDWLRADVALVNSLHMQGIRTLGEGLAAEAMHADGLIEAIRGVDADFAIGVQWHPEFSASTDRLSQSLFMRFGDACRRYVPSCGIVERTSP